MVEKRQISKDIFTLMIPVILENMLQMFAGVVTAALIGRLLTEDIAAQGICQRVIILCWAIFKGIGIGATVVVATRYGEGRLDRCKRTIEQVFLTLAPTAMLFSAIFLLWPHVILGFFSQDPILITKGSEYIRIVAFGLPFTSINLIVTAAFNGQGNTKAPMYIAGILNLVNVTAGSLLIFGGLGIGPMGLRGAAIASALAQMTGALIGLALLYKPNGLYAGFRKSHKFFTVDVDCIKNIYATGIPAAMENMFWCLSAILISKIILSYGSSYFAAYQLGLQAEAITEMPAMGLLVASTTLAARAIGKRDSQLFQLYYRQLFKFSLYIGVGSGMALFIFNGTFMRILTDKPELQAIAAGYVFVMCFAQTPQDMSKVYNGTCRAAGYRNVPMYISAIGIWLVRVPLCIIFGWVLHWSITWIWITILADQLIRVSLSAFVFHKFRIISAVENLPLADDVQSQSVS